jgi:hypothetical protein
MKNEVNKWQKSIQDDDINKGEVSRRTRMRRKMMKIKTMYDYIRGIESSLWVHTKYLTISQSSITHSPAQNK